MKTISYVLISCGLACLLSCQKQSSSSLTEERKTQIADSAKQVAQKVIDLSNKLDFKSVFEFYSADADAHYVENGSVFASLDAVLATYEQFAPTLELLENKVDKWNIHVVSGDAVYMTLPIHLRIKPKGLPEYNGQYVWTGLLQRRNGQWLITQSHESWLNYAEAMAALTPPKTETKN